MLCFSAFSLHCICLSPVCVASGKTRENTLVKKECLPKVDTFAASLGAKFHTVCWFCTAARAAAANVQRAGASQCFRASAPLPHGGQHGGPNILPEHRPKASVNAPEGVCAPKPQSGGAPGPLPAQDLWKHRQEDSAARLRTNCLRRASAHQTTFRRYLLASFPHSTPVRMTSEVPPLRLGSTHSHNLPSW